LHLFDGIEPGFDIAPQVAGRLDEGLIAAHWDDVLQLGTSIRTGVVSASIMLERLGSYPLQTIDGGAPSRGAFPIQARLDGNR